MPLGVFSDLSIRQDQSTQGQGLARVMSLWSKRAKLTSMARACGGHPGRSLAFQLARCHHLSIRMPLVLHSRWCAAYCSLLMPHQAYYEPHAHPVGGKLEHLKNGLEWFAYHLGFASTVLWTKVSSHSPFEKRRASSQRSEYRCRKSQS